MECQTAVTLKASEQESPFFDTIITNKPYKGRKYVFLFYYSYIMADRYDYLPAKKDVIAIINRLYKEYHLEPIDKDTQYFCSFFKEQQK